MAKGSRGYKKALRLYHNWKWIDDPWMERLCYNSKRNYKRNSKKTKERMKHYEHTED
jgi:hypothetical protein